jgi:TonB family protein
MCRRFFVLLSLLAAFTIPAGAQADAWLEVSTPHFSVISNAAEKDARGAALQFERMRSVFARVLPDANMDAATPIVVVAVEDKRSFEALEPAAYLGKGQINIVGLFLHAPEKNYVLILLNAPGQHPYAPIFHEYAHFVQSHTAQWMPLWLSEGWAEFYQTAEILDNEVIVGKLDTDMWQLLQRTPLLPLATLLAIDTHSPYYHEEDKGSIFYAESWALTHYLKMKDARDGTHGVQDYLDLVHKDADSVAAATQAFGDLTQLQAELHKSIMNENFELQHVAGTTDIDDSSFTVRTLTQTQADTVRGDFLAYDQRDIEARILLEHVLHDDPSNVSARESIGLIAFRQGNFDEARKWYEQALKLDPEDLIANYYFAGAVIKGSYDTAARARAESSLRTAIRLNPSFAPANYALGLLLTMQGKNYDEARRWLQKASDMDPGNVEFRIDYANVLIRMNKDKEARAVLELALKMAHTPEQTAAVENVLQTERRLEGERARVQRQGLTPIAGERRTNNAAVVSGNTSGETEAQGSYTPAPDYTEEARRARLEDVCVVSVIIGTDGHTSHIVVTKKLGMGLDEKAVEAVRTWTFEPARRNGRPVLTHLTLKVQFKLIGNDKILQLTDRAKNGDAAAEFDLANAFFDGKDIPRDEERGLAMLERSARDGLGQAQFQMGERTYGNGSNLENCVAAYVWYVLAQRGGMEQGQAKAEILAAQMSPEQLAEAQKRLDNWAGPATK